MKQLLLITISIVCASLAYAQTNTFPATGAAGIGTTTPNASSLLDVQSTSKGVLIPRMNKSQRDAISSPATGLLIYQTNSTPGFYYYSGTAWTAVSVKGPNKSLSNLTSPTGVNVILQPDADNGIDLGSSSFSWKDLYVDGIGYLGTAQVGNYSGSPQAGMIRWTGSAFEGYNGNGWISFGGTAYTAGPGISIVGSTISNTGDVNESDDITTSTSHNGDVTGLYNNLQIAPGAVGSSEIASGSVGTSELANGGIGSSDLSDMGAATGEVMKWNGSAWVPAPDENTTYAAGTAISIAGLTISNTGDTNGSDDANLSLSNLSVTAVNQFLVPDATNTQDLGSMTIGWRDIYLTGKYFMDGVPVLANNGSGDITLVGNAGNPVATGFGITALGAQALFSNTVGHRNTAIGYASLYSNTTGDYNTASGHQALYANTDGNYNTANGNKALFSNTTGNSNMATGHEALYYNTTGYSNTASGNDALRSNTSGFDNTATGFQTLFSNTTGNSNTGTGINALSFNSTGNNNTATGGTALYSNTSGFSNTATGVSAGSVNNASTNCTFVGYDADQDGSTDYANSTAIGSLSRISNSNQVRVGNSSVTSIGGQAGWTTLSDGRYKKNILENVPGLVFINQLIPVTYTLDANGISRFLREDITGEENMTDAEGKQVLYEENKEGKRLAQQGRDAKSAIVYSGFIAQDVEAAATKIGYDFSGVDKPQNEHSLYGLRYAEFVVPLVKAVQEISSLDNLQNEEVENLKRQIKDLKSELEQLKSPLSDGMIRLGVSGEEKTVLLGQNIPNPFENTTIIPFRIPKDCNDASIVIAESSTGKMVRAIPISCNETHLSLEAGLLASGSYTYSLYVDGKIIATKSMVLTK